MIDEVYVLGAYAHARFCLIGYHSSSGQARIPVFSALEEAKKAYLPFNFLFRRLPRGSAEENLLAALESLQFLVYGIPRGLADERFNFVDLEGYDHRPLECLMIDCHPAYLFPIKPGIRLASQYLAYFLLTDILNANPALPSCLRPVYLDRPENDIFKNENAN